MTNHEARFLNLTPDTRLARVLEAAPATLDYIISLNPHDFHRLNNPVMRKYMSPRIALGRVAAMAKVPVEQMLAELVRRSDGHLQWKETNAAAPSPQSPTTAPAWMEGLDKGKLHWVNVLGIDAVQGDPVPPINTAVRRMAPGGVLGIRHEWEPQPLYDIWTRMGIEWYARQVNDHEWEIFVHKPATFPPPNPNESVMVDLRHLPAAEGPPRATAMFEQLPPGHFLEIWGDAGSLLAAREALQESHPGEFSWDEDTGGRARSIARVTAVAAPSQQSLDPP